MHLIKTPTTPPTARVEITLAHGPPCPSPAQLDALARNATAFNTWLELLEALAGGYVPTVDVRRGRGRILAREIELAGYRVYRQG
jgi:hypothetical protein